MVLYSQENTYRIALLYSCIIYQSESVTKEMTWERDLDLTIAYNARTLHLICLELISLPYDRKVSHYFGAHGSSFQYHKSVNG